MAEDPGQQVIRQVLDEVVRGRFAAVHAVLERSREELDPDLAEALGMVAVKLEARELGLQKTLEELRAAKAGLARENRQLRTALASSRPEVLEATANPATAAAYRLAERAAQVDAPVLILGESGTGKEVVAQRIHRLSARHGGPFVALNCAALPETLLESELFGVERGTATGVDARIGKFEAAHKGTLFLDEIGDMSLSTQARILRVLQEREVVRLGSHTPKKVDFRLLAATHRDLPRLAEAGGFRQDLYYRLAIVTVTLPPLRERPEDLLPLARLFLRQLGAGLGHPKASLDARCEAALLAHPWPGNIRELRNALERALLLSDDGLLRAADLSLDAPPRGLAAPAPLPRLKPTPEEERRAIREALAACGDNRSEAARRLGVSRETLRLKMKRLELG